MGILLAVGLRSRGDLFAYSLLTISAAMFMTALTVIMEYVTIVVHPDDYDILAHRPVSPRTYFWAKVGNLLMYVTPIAMALLLPSGIVGGLTLAEGLGFSAAHVLTGLAACLATAAAVVLLYTAALRYVSYARFTSIISYVHSGASLVLVLAYFMLPRIIEDDPSLLSVSRGAWVYFAPPAWFAGTVELLTGAGGRQDAVVALLALAASAAVAVGAMHTISLDYSRRVSELTSSPQVAPATGSGRARRRPFFRMGLTTLGSGGERAGYRLMDAYMQRDRKLRSRIYPAFGLPLAVYIAAFILHDLHSPLRAPPEGGPVALQEVMGLYCVFVSLFFASAMTQSDQWKAGWVFHTAPLADRAGVLQGARRLVVWRYLVPFFLLLFALMAVAVGPLGAAVFVLVVFPLCLAAFSILSLASPHLPLSQAVERTRQVKQLAFFMVLSATMVPLLITIQMTMQMAPAATVPILAVLWAFAWLSERVVRVRLRTRLALEEYGG